MTGSGGSLVSAEESAKQTTQQIKQDFYKGIFHHRTQPTTDQPWQLRSRVNKQGMKNIMFWLEDMKKPVRNIDEFEAALQYLRPVTTPTPEQTGTNRSPSPNKEAVDPNSVLVYPRGSTTAVTLALAKGQKLHTFFNKALGEEAVHCECDGKATCGTCAVDVENAHLVCGKNESKLLKVMGHDPQKSVLSCQHTTDELIGKGATVRLGKR